MPDRQPAKKNPDTASGQSPDKTLLKRLRMRRAALLKRNGRWHLLSPEGEGQRVLPLKTDAVIAVLVKAGALVAGDDGLLRPGTASMAAVRNLRECPLHRLLGAGQDGRETPFEPEHLRAGERLRGRL